MSTCFSSQPDRTSVGSLDRPFLSFFDNNVDGGDYSNDHRDCDCSCHVESGEGHEVPPSLNFRRFAGRIVRYSLYDVLPQRVVICVEGPHKWHNSAVELQRVIYVEFDSDRVCGDACGYCELTVNIVEGAVAVVFVPVQPYGGFGRCFCRCELGEDLQEYQRQN